MRRDFLVATAKREKIRFVATGHTADDQAETVLLRIARGTSISGLAGIPYVSKQAGVAFVRPLRDATRKQIVEFLKTRNAKVMYSVAGGAAAKGAAWDSAKPDGAATEQAGIASPS